MSSEAFTVEVRLQQQNNDGMFRWILATLTALGLVLAWQIIHTPILQEKIPVFKRLEASFIMKPAASPPKTAKPVIRKMESEKIIEKPVLVAEPQPQKMIQPEQQIVQNPRPIYGVRKVFSRGLGSGSGGADAVVAKLGNSLDVPPDTIQATAADFLGEVVSVTRVSQMPRIEVGNKPEYTDEMKKNLVQGKVKARILVDLDGYAKRIIILTDLGFGTKEASIEAIRKMKFTPATVDGKAVAVWIPLTFRFELQA